LGVEGSGAGGAVRGAIPPLILAHLAFRAKAIFLRAAALNFLPLPVGASGVVRGSTCPAAVGASTSRSATSARSMAAFWRSS
jgi:hypothetical protein